MKIKLGSILLFVCFGLFFAPRAFATDYVDYYPPAYSDIYVKSTSDSGAAYKPWFSFDPSLPYTSGAFEDNQWLTGSPTNQRINIDLGASHVVVRVGYKNSFTTSGDLHFTSGVDHLTLWGSNSSTAFADTAYSDDTDWTSLTASIIELAQATAVDQGLSYFTITNSTAYRYYAFKIADNWGNGWGLLGVRKIVLQGEAESAPPPTDTATPEPLPPANGGGPGDGQSDGRSDGLSSCPSCTAAPSTNVPGASTGQVLGASTTALAATGSNDQLGRIMMGAVAALVVFLWATRSCGQMKLR